MHHNEFYKLDKLMNSIYTSVMYMLVLLISVALGKLYKTEKVKE